MAPFDELAGAGEEAELERLVEERCRCREQQEVEEVDRRIWARFGQTAAVVITDLAGFSSRVVAHGILPFLQVIFEHRRVLAPVVSKHGGVLIKAEADSLLCVFNGAGGALASAIEMQAACVAANLSREDERRMVLCVGIGYGRILRIGNRDVWGAEVNAASKLGEDIAQAGEILMTRAARDALTDTKGCRFEELGACVPGSAHNVRVIYEL